MVHPQMTPTKDAHIPRNWRACWCIWLVYIPRCAQKRGTADHQARSHQPQGYSRMVFGNSRGPPGPIACLESPVGFRIPLASRMAGTWHWPFACRLPVCTCAKERAWRVAHRARRGWGRLRVAEPGIWNGTYIHPRVLVRVCTFPITGT